MIDNDRKYFKFILRSAGQLMIDVTRRGKLGAYHSSFFGIIPIGRHCANKFNEDIRYKESLFFIVDVLDKVRQELEPVTNENLDQYYNIYNDIESLRTAYIRSHDGRSSRSITLKVNRIKRNFVNIDQIKENLKNRFINFD